MPQLGEEVELNSPQVLILAHSSLDLDDLSKQLRTRSLRSIVAPGLEKAQCLIGRWRPKVAVIPAGAPRAAVLAQELEELRVPVVLVGTARQLALAQWAGNVEAAVLAPADPAELAGTVDVLVGNHRTVPTRRELQAGPLLLDLAACSAFLGGRRLNLPPKEFHILSELAHHPGEPIPSHELLRRIWPPTALATTKDVHWHVCRLRKLMGNGDGDPAWISNKRGFGYLLNVVKVGQS